MFEDLKKDLKEALTEIGMGEPTVTLHVAKPFCMPCRGIIGPLFRKYGIKMYGLKETTKATSVADFIRRMEVELKQKENLKYGPVALLWLPLAMEAYVTVKEKQAGWAEYLMLRSGRLYVPGRYYNARNYEWARKHGGLLPPAWNDKKPWLEASCSDGIEKYQYLRSITQRKRK